jgi:hypothetical protein
VKSPEIRCDGQLNGRGDSCPSRELDPLVLSLDGTGQSPAAPKRPQASGRVSIRHSPDSILTSAHRGVFLNLPSPTPACAGGGGVGEGDSRGHATLRENG